MIFCIFYKNGKDEQGVNMNKSDNMINKVISFFKNINDDLKNKIYESITYVNRDEKRKFRKIKDINEKISKMLMERSTRERFSQAAYSVVSENVPLDFTATYEDIISSINDENSVFIIIFFFRWCYECDENGVYNDEKYFEKFVDSDLFDRVLSNQPLREDDGKDFDKQDSSLNVEETNKLINEVKTMKLLGRIEKRNTFYNFFPQYELVDGIFNEISCDELKKEYPTNGGINLSYTYSGKSIDFLEDEIKVDLDKDLYVETIYLIEIDCYDLEENNNEAYKIKLDLDKIYSKTSLNKIIKHSNDVGIYKVVESESSVITSSELANRQIFIKEDNVVVGERVVLLYENKYYGPFEVLLRNQDNKFYIKTEASEKNFLIPYHDEKTVQKLEFEKQAHNENPCYTNFVHIVGDADYEDVITNEILLEKIQDDISIDLAKTNPEEFVRKCKNSPFFLESSVADKRIQKLVTLIESTNDFAEEKRKIFDYLLKYYQEKSSILTDDMIYSSDVYKSKEQEIKDQQIRIEQLQSEIEELKNKPQTNELSESVTNDMTDEYMKQIEVLSRENTELNNKISIIDEKENLHKEVNSLKDQRNNLVVEINDYKKQKDSLLDEVRNAIKEASNQAKVAFDPYISSAMMEAAAQWTNKNEIENYVKCKDKMTSISSSELCGNELIAYIVNYVLDRRNYSYNDVVNIYISIAQNFITIFSGEPGTGKTSICNIIAETLGLLNFGDDLNRFVSVSVERGWSSKRDFIGYYNPLTKKYDKSNSKVYDALMRLDTENTESKYPFFIMLDEANLSPIEHYWADFMRLTDRSSINDSYINIGVDKEIYIPETLRFVATINTDQTTEQLSPRLIDRACIIKLPKVDLKSPPQETSDKIISWANFYETFSDETDLSSTTLKILKEIYTLFNNNGMTVSPRIEKVITKYVRIAQGIMIETDGASRSEIAIDYAVIQKLLPKIDGLFLSYKKFFDEMEQLCKEHHLRMTLDALEKMQNDQERNMGYCQYLI